MQCFLLTSKCNVFSWPVNAMFSPDQCCRAGPFFYRLPQYLHAVMTYTEFCKKEEKHLSSKPEPDLTTGSDRLCSTAPVTRLFRAVPAWNSTVCTTVQPLSGLFLPGIRLIALLFRLFQGCSFKWGRRKSVYLLLNSFGGQLGFNLLLGRRLVGDDVGHVPNLEYQKR